MTPAHWKPEGTTTASKRKKKGTKKQGKEIEKRETEDITFCYGSRDLGFFSELPSFPSSCGRYPMHRTTHR